LLIHRVLNRSFLTVSHPPRRPDQAPQRLPGKLPDNPGQHRLFVETARELCAHESPDALDRAFERVVKRKKGTSNKRSRRTG